MIESTQIWKLTHSLSLFLAFLIIIYYEWIEDGGNVFHVEIKESSNRKNECIFTFGFFKVFKTQLFSMSIYKELANDIKLKHNY